MSSRASTRRPVAAILGGYIRATPLWVPALLVALVGLIDLAPETARARDLTGAERAALARRVDDYLAAMRGGQSETLADIVPPRMLSYIALQRHISIDALHRSMVEQLDKVEASGIIVSYDIDLAAARHETLADGTPYVLIPTDTVLKAGGHKIDKHTNTLAFMDDGVWYFVRINTPTLVARLTAVYPHFAGVDLAGETTTLVP